MDHDAREGETAPGSPLPLTTYYVKMRIAQEARKHGVPDDDITWAHDHYLHRDEDDQGEHLMRMYVGPSKDGNALIEVGVIYPDTEPEGVALHALRPARQKYLRKKR